MYKIALVLLLIVVTGAGCVSVEPSNEGDTLESVENVSDDNGAEQENMIVERGIDISNDSDAVSYFGDTRTSQHLYDSYKMFREYRDRMVKDLVDADPAGMDYYKKFTWAGEDAAAQAMVKAGENATLAMSNARDAFQNNNPQESSLSSEARSKLLVWLERIKDFEGRWGVGPR